MLLLIMSCVYIHKLVLQINIWSCLNNWLWTFWEGKKKLISPVIWRFWHPVPPANKNKMIHVLMYRQSIIQLPLSCEFHSTDGIPFHPNKYSVSTGPWLASQCNKAANLVWLLAIAQWFWDVTVHPMTTVLRWLEPEQFLGFFFF